MSKFTEKSNSHQHSIDEAAGIIRNVKLLGQLSKNKRRYPPDTLRSAAPLYEGVKVYLDHQREGTDRSIKDWVGNIQNVRVKPDGLHGDFHAIQNSQHYPMIMEVASKSPRSFGFSHVAEGKSSFDSATGEEIVESITQVFSVDLVTEPATTAGIFESAVYSKPEAEGIDALVLMAKAIGEAGAEEVQRHFDSGDQTPFTPGQLAVEVVQTQLMDWMNAEARGEMMKQAHEAVDHALDALAGVFANPTQPYAMQSLATITAEVVEQLQGIANGDPLQKPLAQESVDNFSAPVKEIWSGQPTFKEILAKVPKRPTGVFDRLKRRH